MSNTVKEIKDLEALILEGCPNVPKRIRAIEKGFPDGFAFEVLAAWNGSITHAFVIYNEMFAAKWEVIISVNLDRDNKAVVSFFQGSELDCVEARGDDVAKTMLIAMLRAMIFEATQ